MHSKYSRATSSDCDLAHLSYWAQRKGIAVLGTGDFTHPAWMAELREHLVPAEPGLFRLRDDRIAEHWHQFDRIGVLQQLGVMPAPQRESA